MMLVKPTTTETKEEYIARAMYDKAMKDEYEDIDERKKMCEAFWNQSKTVEGGVERRSSVLEDTELRLTDDKTPRIAGYAARFGKWSEDLGGFREKIRVGAFDDVLDDDVRALKNHDPNLLLGRNKSKTLKLTANKTGLRFEIDTPDTNVGRDVIEEIRRGDISGCSFGFVIESDEWRYLEDGSVERTIIKLKRLMDISVVTYPAYPDTTVAARSLDRFKAERDMAKKVEEEESAKAAESEEKNKQEEKEKRKSQREIEKKYNHAGRIISRNRSAED